MARTLVVATRLAWSSAVIPFANVNRQVTVSGHPQHEIEIVQQHVVDHAGMSAAGRRSDAKSPDVRPAAQLGRAQTGQGGVESLDEAAHQGDIQVGGGSDEPTCLGQRQSEWLFDQNRQSRLQQFQRNIGVGR
jgi:hypothetical protein